MRVLHVVRDLNAASGGPSQSVPNLHLSLLAKQIDSHLLFEDVNQPLSDVVVEQSNLRAKAFYPVQRSGRFWNASSFHSVISSNFGRESWDIIHVHGLWTGINHAAAHYARKQKIPYVISPRGMLAQWAIDHKKIRKRIAMWLYQRRDLQQASLLHATSSAEAAQFKRLGLSGPTSIISNGTAFPPRDIKAISRSPRRALFLSRIHPVKGVVNLVKAWANVRPENWECIICGPDENDHAAVVQREIDAAGLAEHVCIVPAVAGDEKWRLFKSAELFILPSHTENFGIAIAEALACGLPVITTRGTPWEVLESNRCGWWIEDSIEALGSAMKIACELPRRELLAMGLRGNEYASNIFSWDQKAAEMIDLYKNTQAEG
jgi:glycosyltransferase involved in cell wall biosynthesis